MTLWSAARSTAMTSGVGSTQGAVVVIVMVPSTVGMAAPVACALVVAACVTVVALSSADSQGGSVAASVVDGRGAVGSVTLMESRMPSATLGSTPSPRSTNTSL